MSMIDDFKNRAAGYLESAERKKGELVDKAVLLKKEYDDNQRKKMEEWIYKKEAELKALEDKLKKREAIIIKNELRLKSKFVVRFIGVAAGLSAIGFFATAAFITTTDTGIYSLSTQAKNTEKKLSIPRSSDPYTHRESAVYGAYGDIDVKNPNFDVGNYCLEKEKRGGITFEECLGVAAARIMSSK